MWVIYITTQRSIRSSGQALNISWCLAISSLVRVCVCYEVEILLCSHGCGVYSPWVWFNKPFPLSDILAWLFLPLPTPDTCSKNLRWQMGELLADF